MAHGFQCHCERIEKVRETILNLSYGDFEGVITEGYGKNTVSICDEGEYDWVSGNSENRLIKFVGDRARGNYHLMKWKDNKWLIWRL